MDCLLASLAPEEGLRHDGLLMVETRIFVHVFPKVSIVGAAAKALEDFLLEALRDRE